MNTSLVKFYGSSGMAESKLANSTSPVYDDLFDSVYHDRGNGDEDSDDSDIVKVAVTQILNISDYYGTIIPTVGLKRDQDDQEESVLNNWWAMLALVLVVGTAAGNILVCLAITWERRLQNVTNYFLMSLAITDLMVAVLVMPVGILTLVRGKSTHIKLIYYVLCTEILFPLFFFFHNPF